MLQTYVYDPPEPGAWRGEDRSTENSEGWRSGFLSEIGRVPASEAEADCDAGAARSEPGLVRREVSGLLRPGRGPGSRLRHGQMTHSFLGFGIYTAQ